MKTSAHDTAFQRDGFVVVKNVISPVMVRQIKERVFKNIKKCYEELEVSKENYLSAVSRWVSPSPVTSELPASLLGALEKETKNIVGDTPVLKKLNVICKNKHCTGAIPYHQDIAYSSQDPYQLSAWLALHDTREGSGSLEVIPGSHLSPISPAVDFWSPDFMQEAFREKHAIKLLPSAGDVVFFDSRLWHGSAEKKDTASRYALVTRWTSHNWKQTQVIPPITPKIFGMWTSGQMTQDILTQGLEFLFKRREDDFVKLLETWIILLEHGNHGLPFHMDVTRVIDSLRKVKILHLAFLKHNGGDATGTIYKNLWTCFLSPMRAILQSSKQKRGAI